jgi:flagellar assembly factor FliW
VKVETKWFGTVEIDDSKIITFEKGLMGFEDYKKFVIVYESEEDREHSIMWLQSLDEVALALPVIRPELIKEDYDPVVEDELVFGLGENICDANLLVLVTLTVPQDIKKMACNLKAPIIINTDTMKAVQLVANNEDYVVRYPIYEILEKRKKEG